MKKLLLTAAISLSSLALYADFQDDGYYRVQNAITKRYAYLLDNKGTFDPGRGTADVKALKLFMDQEKMMSDPSTVFYIDCVSGQGASVQNCNIAGQGTSLYDFFHEYMKVRSGKVVDGQQSYYAYATKGAFTKYLGDLEDDLTEDAGYADVDAKGDYRLWYILPLDASSDKSFFGINPSMNAGGMFYKPFYAAFPFSAYSGGMKYYIVSHVDANNGIAVIKEVEGVIPASCPVIAQCSSESYLGNRLNIGGQAEPVSGNRLSGVYFNNDRPAAHKNLTPYNKRTMRLLTVKDGKLVFDVADETYLPRNEAYLQLNSEKEYAVATYQILNEDEYEEHYGAVESIGIESVVNVYSADGHLVKEGITHGEVYTLPKGLYILRSGSAMEKLLVP